MEDLLFLAALRIMAEVIIVRANSILRDVEGGVEFALAEFPQYGVLYKEHSIRLIWNTGTNFSEHMSGFYITLYEFSPQAPLDFYLLERAIKSRLG